MFVIISPCFNLLLTVIERVMIVVLVSVRVELTAWSSKFCGFSLKKLEKALKLPVFLVLPYMKPSLIAINNHNDSNHEVEKKDKELGVSLPIVVKLRLLLKRSQDMFGA